MSFEDGNRFIFEGKKNRPFVLIHYGGFMNYGYVRVSTPNQNIERQIRNIYSMCSDVILFKEVYTRTRFYGRKEWEKLMRTVKPGDTIYFDSVSRMSGNEAEGFTLYEELYNKKIRLVFYNEPHINTDTYRNALETQVALTGTNVDYILEGVNNFLMALAKEQIRLAFQQSEKEVMDLRQRTKEGVETARLNGRQIGLKKGTKLVTKKSVEAKKIILKHNKNFGGGLTNEETWKLARISKMTFYKYLSELRKDTF